MLQRLIVQDALHHLAAEIEVLQSHQILDIELQGFASGPTHHFFRGLVQGGDVAIQVQREDNTLGIFEEVVKTLLGLTDFVFGAHTLDGVFQSSPQQFRAERFLHQVVRSTGGQDLIPQRVFLRRNQGQDRQGIILSVNFGYASQRGAVKKVEIQEQRIDALVYIVGDSLTRASSGNHDLKRRILAALQHIADDLGKRGITLHYQNSVES